MRAGRGREHGGEPHDQDVAAIEAMTSRRLGDTVFSAALARGAALGQASVLAIARSAT